MWWLSSTAPSGKPVSWAHTEKAFQGHEVPAISSGLFRGHRAETKHLGSSEGRIAGSHVGRELRDRLGQVCGEGTCLRTWRPGMGLEVGTSHLFPV